MRTLADGLVRRGVATGDRVVVSLPNSTAAVEMYLACALVGAIWVGVNPAAPTAERDRQRGLVNPALTVVDESSDYAQDGRCIVEVAELASAKEFDGRPPPLHAPCAIGFSSGTTGRPKALVHSRSGVSLAAAVLADVSVRPDDRVGVILPMSIHNLIVVAALAPLFARATCVPVRRMSAPGVAGACADLRLTKLNALVPATIYDLVHDSSVAANALSGLRTAGTGAAGLSEPLRRAFEEKFGVRLTGSYGMTEAPGVVAIESADAAHIEGGSGIPLPHLRIDACDERGAKLPAGNEGDLVVSASDSGPWAGAYRPAMGTWSSGALRLRPSEVSELRTGDRGWVDRDGTVHVTGRQADVIIRGGVSMNVAELESVLKELPGVRDVAVIGVPDERLGQRIAAFVESTPGCTLDPRELKASARELLSHGKAPDAMVVGELPRNAMGKVARGQLRIEKD